TFMRGTKAPPVDPIQMGTSDARTGQSIFTSIGCAICHVTAITTAPTETVINGGAFTVPSGTRQQNHSPLQRLPAAQPQYRGRYCSERATRHRPQDEY